MGTSTLSTFGKRSFIVFAFGCLLIIAVIAGTTWRDSCQNLASNGKSITEKNDLSASTLRQEYLAILKNSLTGRSVPFYQAATADDSFRSKNNKNAILKFSGYNRIATIEPLIQQVIEEGVEGDFCECGVFLGGMSIYLAGFLKAYGQSQRHMWVVDSFEGMPDNEGAWSKGDYEGSLEVVRSHFQNFNLLNDNLVHFVRGWFDQTLPAAPMQKIAFLHVDCDTYSATMTVLENLYPRMAKGGWIVFDDYHSVNQQRKAVLEYKAKMGISREIESYIVPGYLEVGRWRVE